MSSASLHTDRMDSSGEDKPSAPGNAGKRRSPRRESRRLTMTLRFAEDDLIDAAILKQYDRARSQHEAAEFLRRIMAAGYSLLYGGVDVALKLHPSAAQQKP